MKKIRPWKHFQRQFLFNYITIKINIKKSLKHLDSRKKNIFLKSKSSFPIYAFIPCLDKTCGFY